MSLHGFYCRLALIVAAQHDGGDHGRPKDCPAEWIPEDAPEDHTDCKLIDVDKQLCKCFPSTDKPERPARPFGATSKEEKKELKAKAIKKKQVM